AIAHGLRIFFGLRIVDSQTEILDEPRDNGHGFITKEAGPVIVQIEGKSCVVAARWHRRIFRHLVILDAEINTRIGILIPELVLVSLEVSHLLGPLRDGFKIKPLRLARTKEEIEAHMVILTFKGSVSVQIPFCRRPIAEPLAERSKKK